MQATSTQFDFYRWGAASAMLGAVLGVIFNLLHPRPDAVTPRAELQMIADSDIWRFDHIMLGVATVFLFIGIIAIGLSMFGTAADIWARAWLIFSAVSTSVLLVLIALDGTAAKAVATRWAESGNDPAIFASAEMFVSITLALLGVSIGLVFGVAPLLLGMAILSGGGYPKVMGQVSLVAGALGLIDALILAISGISAFALNVLFPIASVLFTIVLFWAGWELWKRSVPTGRTVDVTERTAERTTAP